MINRMHLKDILFYSVVTLVFMVTSAFGAIEGWLGSGISTFDAPPISDRAYVTLAGVYGALCSVGCSIPFLLVLLALRLGSVTKRRMASIWFIGNVSACFYAIVFMILTVTFSGEIEEYYPPLFAAAAALPPGVQGLRVIRQIARKDRISPQPV
jgi:hypothetical protein